MGKLKQEVTGIITRMNKGHAWVTVDKGHGDKSGKKTPIPITKLISLEPPPLEIAAPPHEDAASRTTTALATTAAMQGRDAATAAAEEADAKATAAAAAEAAAKAAAAAEAAAKLAAAEAAAKKATKEWEEITNMCSDVE